MDTYKIKWTIGYLKKNMTLRAKRYVKNILGRYKIKKYNQFGYPIVLQLPITYKCNCDCVTCGMLTQQKKNNFSADQLGIILNDNLFKNIQSVGVNGGEPFLVKNLYEYINKIIEKLPKLKDIYIISNGYFTDVIISQMKIMKKNCQEKNIRLHISISIDGIGEKHNEIRGVSNIFDRACKTCDELLKHKELYDSFNIICTISKLNIIDIYEIDEWMKLKGYPVNYNIATVHKRLNNIYKYSDFSIMDDEYYKHLAMEFFYYKFASTKSVEYFGLYYYLRFNKRIAKCTYQNNGVTLTPDCQIAYCATYSDALGDASTCSAIDIFKSNLNYRKKLCSESCQTCSHYCGSLTEEGDKLYNDEIKKLMCNPFWM